MKINLEVIAHKKQRYPTVGDYWQDAKGTWQFRVSKLGDSRYEQLVFLHELTELTLVLQAGIELKEIDKFDFAYEQARNKRDKRAPCGCKFKDEPGEDHHCPYRVEHYTASKAERIAAKAMGVDWKKYNDALEAL